MTLSRISAPALIVKVIATTDSGRSTMPRSARIRCTSSPVFPDPAGAFTMNERSVWIACSRSANVDRLRVNHRRRPSEPAPLPEYGTKLGDCNTYRHHAVDQRLRVQP